MVLNRTLYAVFVGLLAFSPLLSFVLSDAFGRPIGRYDWLTFMWVGVALSLPGTLAVAKLMGRDEYCAYWAYLKSFRAGSSRATILGAWGMATMVTLAIGFGLIR